MMVFATLDENKCEQNSGQCSQLCLDSEIGGKKCSCRQGYYLADDNQTCLGV